MNGYNVGHSSAENSRNAVKAKAKKVLYANIYKICRRRTELYEI